MSTTTNTNTKSPLGDPLLKVPFIQHILFFIEHNKAGRLVELSTVSDAWHDTVSHYAEAIFHRWKTLSESKDAFDKHFFFVATRRIGISLNFVPQMLAAGASPNAKGPSQKPIPDMWGQLRHFDVALVRSLANRGHADTLELVCAAGAELDNLAKATPQDPGEDGSSAIMGSCYHGFEECVEVLLRHRANPSAKTTFGVTPLAAAVSSGQVKIVEMLLDAGADVSSVDQRGLNALAQACNCNTEKHVQCVKRLLAAHQRGNVAIDTGYPQSGGITPLHCACRGGCVEIVDLLVGAGAGIEVIDANGGNALFHAAASGRWQVVEKLLHLGANVNARNAQGWTPLHTAVVHCTPDNLPPQVQQQLQMMQQMGHHKLPDRDDQQATLKALISGGAKVSAKLDDGTTLPMLVAQHGRADILHILLDNLDPGASIDEARSDGTTALVLCGSYNHVECLKLCIELGANVEQELRDAHGARTTLVIAASGGHIGVVEELLRAGARRSYKYQGKTPLEWAREQHRAYSAQLGAMSASGGFLGLMPGGPTAAAATQQYEEIVERFEKIVGLLECSDDAIIAEEQRRVGNAAFAAGMFDEAIVHYDDALETLAGVDLKTSNSDAEDIKAKKIACFTNMSLCHLKLSRFSDAHAAADSALELEQGFKAFFRRGQAAKGMAQIAEGSKDNLAAAARDFRKCLEMDPKNVDAKAQLDEVVEMQQQQQQ